MTKTKQCPHCGRTFNFLTAERHIPHCQKTRARPKPPPTKEALTSRMRQRK